MNMHAFDVTGLAEANFDGGTASSVTTQFDELPLPPLLLTTT
jgi:hypothetical protein